MKDKAPKQDDEMMFKPAKHSYIQEKRLILAITDEGLKTGYYVEHENCLCQYDEYGSGWTQRFKWWMYADEAISVLSQPHARKSDDRNKEAENVIRQAHGYLYLNWADDGSLKDRLEAFLNEQEEM